MERARGLDIAGDLRAEFLDAGEFFFRAQVPSEGEFELDPPHAESAMVSAASAAPTRSLRIAIRLLRLPPLATE